MVWISKKVSRENKLNSDFAINLKIGKYFMGLVSKMVWLNCLKNSKVFNVIKLMTLLTLLYSKGYSDLT